MAPTAVTISRTTTITVSGARQHGLATWDERDSAGTAVGTGAGAGTGAGEAPAAGWWQASLPLGGGGAATVAAAVPII